MAFFDFILDGVIITNLEGKIVYTNQQANAIFHSEENQLNELDCNLLFQSSNIFSELVSELGINKRIIRSLDCKTSGGLPIKTQFCISVYFQMTIYL